MFIFLAFLFGTIIGSFLNVLILRLPKEEQITGRSKCESCRRSLSIIDLVPIISFLALKGRCRHCASRISSRYIIIETAAGLLFALAWQQILPDSLASFLRLLQYWFIISCLVVIFVVDLEHYLILDKVIFPASAVLLLFNLAQGRFVSGLVGAAVLALPFFLIWHGSKGQWMGFGDVKLAIFLGLALGWPNILPGFTLAILLGGVVSVVLLATTSKTLKSRVPFGTFLSIGALLALFCGQQMINWYLAFLGF